MLSTAHAEEARLNNLREELLDSRILRLPFLLNSIDPLQNLQFPLYEVRAQGQSDKEALTRIIYVLHNECLGIVVDQVHCLELVLVHDCHAENHLVEYR